MAVFRNCPFRHGMTGSTIAAEEAPVAILRGMAGRAVQCRLKRRNIWVGADNTFAKTGGKSMNENKAFGSKL